jgi:UDP-N-acetylglucosamine 2-epimerase
MSQIFFDELDIPEPDLNLGVGSGSHGAQTGAMLERIEQVLLEENPDWVLVYGDTNSTLAGALTAAKLHFPVAHVEAGLRSFNRAMPEEINRVLTDHVSDLLFCPTKTAVENLAAEGITKGVHHTGDVMYDAVLHYTDKARERSTILDELELEKGGYLLATVHRPSNTDDSCNLRAIFAALAETEETVVLPAHPRTRAAISENRIEVAENIRVIEPLGYLDMLQLERNARLILTDSGGIQKEAYFFAVPCITLREETEWVETVEAGWNVLVGADRDRILDSVCNLSPLRSCLNLLGEGRAAQQLVHFLESIISVSEELRR